MQEIHVRWTRALALSLGCICCREPNETFRIKSDMKQHSQLLENIKKCYNLCHQDNCKGWNMDPSKMTTESHIHPKVTVIWPICINKIISLLSKRRLSKLWCVTALIINLQTFSAVSRQWLCPRRHNWWWRGGVLVGGPSYSPPSHWEALHRERCSGLGVKLEPTTEVMI